MNNHKQKWTDYYKNQNPLMFPNEYLIRSMVGNYPNFSLNEKQTNTKNILDVSCGDGRNLRLLSSLGYKVYGTEISEEICIKTKSNLNSIGIYIPNENIRVGTNDQLPFTDSFFDYIVSWNAIYYVKDQNSSITKNIEEHSRVLKSGGRLICCVPAPSCYSLIGAEPVGEFIRIKPISHENWGQGVLDGMIFYSFKNKTNIRKKFGASFKNFKFAHLNDDCFGLPLKYIIFIAEKK